MDALMRQRNVALNEAADLAGQIVVRDAMIAERDQRIAALEAEIAKLKAPAVDAMIAEAAKAAATKKPGKE